MKLVIIEPLGVEEEKLMEIAHKHCQILSRSYLTRPK